MASNRGPNAVGSSTASASQQNSEYYKARNAGGSAFQWAGGAAPAAPVGNPNIASGGVGGVGGSWASAAPTPSPAPQTSVAAQSRAQAHGAAVVASSVPVTNNSLNSATSNGMYEKNLIAELCPPGGMKAEPPQDKLQDFARAVPSLNPDWVCPALLDALEEGNPWIMRAKALCVIETVLKVMAENTEEGGSNAYADFFHACSEEIAPLASHARVAVKGPAKRVLMELGLGEEGVAMNGGGGGSVTAVVSAPVVEAPNLLDFDEPTPAVPTVAAPVAPPPLPVQVASTPQPTMTMGSGGGDSLFSGLNTKRAAPSPVPVQAATTSALASMPQQDDLLGDIEASTESAQAAAPPAASGDLFGDMSVKSAENGVASALVPEVSVIVDVFYSTILLSQSFSAHLPQLAVKRSTRCTWICVWFHECISSTCPSSRSTYRSIYTRIATESSF